MRPNLILHIGLFSRLGLILRAAEIRRRNAEGAGIWAFKWQQGDQKDAAWLCIIGPTLVIYLSSYS